MKTRFLAVSLFSLFPLLAQAASFDCSKAASVTEKLICNDETVSKLDEQLAASYKQALANTADPDSIKKSQVEWLKQQRACKDADCLAKTYQQRIGELTSITADKKEQAAATPAIPVSESKKPLTFTLTKGEGYPMCKQYVEMLNATKYPNIGALACERKNLPNYPLFKSPQWTEITDKAQMEKIIKERITIRRAKTTWKKEQVDSEINDFMMYLKEGHLKIFSFKDDFDKDGIIDTAYKFEIFYPVPDESVDCNYQTLNYVDDGKTTVENAEYMNTRDAARYRGFSSSGNDKLFYYENTIFSSSLSGDPSVNVWMLGYNTICEMAVH